MKKITILITILLTLTACTNNNSNNNLSNTTEINIDETIKNDNYIDNNPIKIALYENNKIIKSYKTTLSNFKDIAVFDIFFTNEETITENNTKNNYLKYYNQYQNIKNYKTGFFFSFIADGKKIEHLALGPNSMHAMSPYIYIYLYDDINQEPNTYYSHLESSDMKESTIISSIKLFLAQEGTKIESPITMTVFTYDNEEDFKDNHYRGTSSYTINIHTN